MAGANLKELGKASMENILPFPADKIVRLSQTGGEEVTEEEVKARVQLMRTLHVQEVIETLMPIVFSQLSIGGFDLSNEEDIKDAAFITEAIRSVMCKQKGIDHPFQQVADQIFVNESDGILSVVDNINIKFGSQPEMPVSADVVEEATPN